MSIIINDNLAVNVGKPVDSKYLNITTPWTSVSAAEAGIPITYRYLGLTVNVAGVEYWWKNSIANGSLIEKIFNTTIPVGNFITGGTNLGYFSGKTGIQILPIDHLTNNNYDGAYYSQYNYYYRGTDGIIHIGTPSDGIPRRGYVKSTLPVKSWIWNEYTGSSNQVGWILIDGDISNLIGTFQFGVTYYPPSTPHVETGYTAGTPYPSLSNIVINSVIGSLTTGATLTIGGRPFAFPDHNNLHFRTIISETPELINVWDDNDTFIHVSGTTVVLHGGSKGSGEDIFLGQTGTTLYFKRIRGSGGTTVTTVGDSIVVTASGGSGGGTYNLSSPAVCTVGGITAGTPLTGKTAFQLFEEILVPSLNPSFIAPYVTTSFTPSGIMEVGTTLPSFDICSLYNAGSITPVYPPTASSCRSCGVIGYCFTSTGGQVDGYYADGVTLHIKTIPSYTVSAGTQTWGTCARHCAGVQPYNSKGVAYDSPLTTGFTVASSADITGIYPWFWGSTASAPVVGQALFNNYLTCGGGKCLASSTGKLDVTNYNITGRFIWFATPANSTTKTIWQGCNNPSNNGTIPDSFIASPQTISITSPDGCGWTCNYKVYVSNYATNINYGMAFCN